MCCIGMLGLVGVLFYVKMIDKKVEWFYFLYEISEVDFIVSSFRFW